jgi:endoglucanase
MDIKHYLKLLCEASGPTGFERPVAEIAAEAIKPLVDEVRVDTLANVVAVKHCGKANAAKLLLAAHLDEVGLVVTGHEDGFLCIGQIGGLDARVLPDRDLLILTDPPRLGVVCVQPPHVLKAEDMSKAIKQEDLRVDVGLTQEQAVREVPIGTPVVYRTEGFELLNGRYVSKALDDRACFVILLRAAEIINEELAGGRELPWDVYFIGSSGEERSEGGAAAAAFDSDADVCIAVDVGQAKAPDSTPAIHMDLGKGPILKVGPNFTKFVEKRFTELAEREQIPVQRVATPGKSGTDAWFMHIVKGGVASGIFELPLRYMHSPAECLDFGDVEACARLLAAYALDPGKEALEC